MKSALQFQETGGSAAAVEIQLAAERASDETRAAPVAHGHPGQDVPIRRYELSRPRDAWVLLEVQTGVRRPYGLCTKEQALRRAATFLRGRPGTSSLVIRSKKGEFQSERFYHGETEK